MMGASTILSGNDTVCCVLPFSHHPCHVLLVTGQPGWHYEGFALVIEAVAAVRCLECTEEGAPLEGGRLYLLKMVPDLLGLDLHQFQGLQYMRCCDADSVTATPQLEAAIKRQLLGKFGSKVDGEC